MENCVKIMFRNRPFFAWSNIKYLNVSNVGLWFYLPGIQLWSKVAFSDSQPLKISFFFRELLDWHISAIACKLDWHCAGLCRAKPRIKRTLKLRLVGLEYVLTWFCSLNDYEFTLKFHFLANCHWCFDDLFWFVKEPVM